LNRVVSKRFLNDSVVWLDLEAGQIAQRAQAGQFVVLRIDESGERIPLTIAEADADHQTVSVIFQIVGASTLKLADLEPGDYLADLVGPLGQALQVQPGFRVCVIGGGVGCAVAYPQAKALAQRGLDVDMIVGFRNHDLVILEDEMRAAVANLYVVTDDGSYVEKGFVTTKLEALLNAGQHYDLAIAIGPTIMMKMTCALTAKYNLPTEVSLNPIMVDGTGMCGCCRVTVDGQTRFACVDGPDFDGHLVDWDELMARNAFYQEPEAAAYTRQQELHRCKLTGELR